MAKTEKGHGNEVIATLSHPTQVSLLCLFWYPIDKKGRTFLNRVNIKF